MLYLQSHTWKFKICNDLDIIYLQPPTPRYYTCNNPPGYFILATTHLETIHSIATTHLDILNLRNYPHGYIKLATIHLDILYLQPPTWVPPMPESEKDESGYLTNVPVLHELQGEQNIQLTFFIKK